MDGPLSEHHISECYTDLWVMWLSQMVAWVSQYYYGIQASHQLNENCPAAGRGASFFLVFLVVEANKWPSSSFDT